GVTSTIVAPLVLHGRVLGTLRLAMAESGRRYTDEDLSLAKEIAHHAALVIEGARLYRAAQTAIGARDNLLAVVSHDLRNYLSTMQAGSDRWPRACLVGGERKVNRLVEALKRSASRMGQLIEGLRDATMIETGQLRIRAARENVAALIDEALHTLEPQAEARS